MRFKKIASIFLTAALILSMLPIVGSAENTEIFKVEVEAETTASTVSATPIIYNQGEEITVKISASQNTGITTLWLRIDYDETVLEPVDGKFAAKNLFTDEDVLAKKVDADGNRFFSFYFDSYPTVKDQTGVFAEITFVAKEACATETGISIELYTPNSCARDTFLEYINVPFACETPTFAVHNIVAAGVVTAPTCLEQGYTTYTCASCEKFAVGNYVAANGHTAGEAVVENRVEPSCTAEGSYDSVVYCSVSGCKAELSREHKTIPMSPHEPADAVEENRKEATCTADGSYDLVVYCKSEDCKAELSREHKTIPMSPHEPADAVEENRKEATCTADGSYDLVVYCKAEGCKAEISRENKVIPMLDHKLVHHEAQEATHTQIGWNEYDTCEDCEYTTYVEIPIVPYMTGDVTGDDEITDADAIYLLYATFNPEKYPLNQTADYNGDGEVTDADAIYLLYATFNPEKYPLA